jgi:cell division protein FtsB
MFNFFKKLFMKKEEMEKQLADAIAVAQKLNKENQQLLLTVDNLNIEINKLKTDFGSAVERVQYLAEQLRMREAQQIASERFNDNDRNY